MNNAEYYNITFFACDISLVSCGKKRNRPTVLWWTDSHMIMIFLKTEQGLFTFQVSSLCLCSLGKRAVKCILE